MNKIASTGLFLVSYHVGTEAPGALSLTLALAVDTVRERVTGAAQLFQATSPPLDIRYDVGGEFADLDGSNRISVKLAGSEKLEPHAGGLLGIDVKMTLSKDWKSGEATYRYRKGAEMITVGPVPVRQIEG